MRSREPFRVPEPPTRLTISVTLNATAEQIAAMAKPQRDALLRGLGDCMAAAREGTPFGEQGPSDG